MGVHRVALALIGICAGAAALRATGFEWVFVGDEIHLAVGDAHSIARSASVSLANFPSLYAFDPYINYPDGGVPQGGAFLGFALAGLVRLLGGGLPTLEHVLAWWSPLLGSLVPIPVYFAARTVGSRGVALGAAALAAGLPLLVSIAKVGEADHHAAQSLLSALWLMGALRLAAGTGAAGAAAGLAATRLAMVTLWSGSLLYLIVADGLLVGVGVLSGRPALLRRLGASALATALCLAPILALAPVPAAGPWSMVALSRTHGVVLLLLAALAWACAWRGRQAPERSVVKRVIETGALAAGLAALVLAWPGPRDALGRALGFFADSSGGSGVLIAELLPLFPVLGRPAGIHAPAFFGGFAWLVPLTPVLAALAARDPARRAPAWLLCAWTAVYGALAIGQVRFGTDFAASAVVAFAIGLGELARLARGLGLPRAAAAGLAVGLAVAALWTPLRSYASALRASLGASRGEIFLGDRALATAGGSLIRFLQTVRRVTPETSGWRDAGERPEYGILCRPGLGHSLQYVGRRASPANGFLHDVGPEIYRASQAFFDTTDEAAALAIARELEARYVIVGYPPRPRPAAMEHRLMAVGVGAPEPRPLTRFRLLTEGPRGGRPLGELLGLSAPPGAIPYRLFEIVEGAEVRVAASPGERVVASVELQAPLAGTFRWQSAVAADADGRARLRVPYPTESVAPVRALAPYSVRVGGRRHLVHVSEADVREGREVAVGPPE